MVDGDLGSNDMPTRLILVVPFFWSLKSSRFPSEAVLLLLLTSHTPMFCQNVCSVFSCCHYLLSFSTQSGQIFILPFMPSYIHYLQTYWDLLSTWSWAFDFGFTFFPVCNRLEVNVFADLIRIFCCIDNGPKFSSEKPSKNLLWRFSKPPVILFKFTLKILDVAQLAALEIEVKLLSKHVRMKCLGVLSKPRIKHLAGDLWRMTRSDVSVLIGHMWHSYRFAGFSVQFHQDLWLYVHSCFLSSCTSKGLRLIIVTLMIVQSTIIGTQVNFGIKSEWDNAILQLNRASSLTRIRIESIHLRYSQHHLIFILLIIL